MEPKSQEGPDASSLKPVSSLRSHFESMGKIKEEPCSPAAAPVPAPAPAITTSPMPIRQRTPSPKPPPVPDTRPPRPKSMIVMDAGRSRLQPPNSRDYAPVTSTGASLRPAQAVNPPPISPKPIKPPSVFVDPPHSPPNSRAPARATADVDAAALLNPDPVKTPATPVTPTRPFKIPSRPTTPNLEPRRASPRLSTPQPPSPPPPRRSAELRRERDAKISPAVPAPVPPPVNRADKPSARLSMVVDNAPKLEPKPAQGKLDRHSPFNTPPTMATTLEDEESPPMLPTRPARPVSHMPSIVRTNTLPAAFDPPPIHSAIASKRRDPETNGGARLPPTSATPTDPPPPALPSRPAVVPESHPKIPAYATMRPPPRPARASITSIPIAVNTTETTQQPKRVASTPTTQFAPPPTRTHNRSMTVDRTNERAPLELQEPLRRVPAVGVSPISSNAPPAGPPSSVQATTAYPDASRVNRRPPFAKHGVHEIQTKYDPRKIDVCGEYVCTSGILTRVWNMHDGELLTSFAHGEGIKATSVAFKPGINVNQEGLRIWIGNNIGEVMEADIATQSLVGSKTNVHGRNEVIKIFRHYNEMWTLDDGGTLHVWGPDGGGVPNLNNSPHQTYRLAKGHTFSIIVGEQLWYATGKEIRIFAPTVDGSTQVQVLMRPMITEGAGEITSGTLLKSEPGKVYFGHTDGKVSIYSRKDFACLGVLSISTYKINSLAGVGNHIWAAYNNGRISIYDVRSSPWTVKKDWQAHNDSPALRLIADPASFYRLGRQQVLSLGADNMVRVWDGLLEDDFLENEMKSMDSQYSVFEDIRVQAMTWNAGASTPNSLRYAESDSMFIQNLLQSSNCPDILIFGFQELVDLEDKTATAKRLFKSKKKDATDQERMSHQYRDWRDFLVRSLDDFMPADHLYHLLHTATLVGLFTCIFVKSTLRERIGNISSADVKRGMGGLHGNKGAIVVRFMLDDTSLCFINCHLAAGQTQANSRHNDIAAILDSSILPVEPDKGVRIDSYIGGGDGSMILDHELCLLNGDLNYRIDTMSRDTVVYAVKANNLTKLLERDQLLVARRRNPAFRLRAFEELPIEFAPTYKYDVGTDNYDTSEKKRAPAWCDRLLYRGSGRIQQLDYRRHEVRVSDHRPVTGQFKFTVKKISPKKRILVWADCLQHFEDLKMKEANEETLSYLMNVIGYDLTTSKSLMQDQHRSNGKPNHNKG